jgi:hypothetical protein
MGVSHCEWYIFKGNLASSLIWVNYNDLTVIQYSEILQFSPINSIFNIPMIINDNLIKPRPR